jgi:outer membrane murein-binding lipoprotein Lpp
MKNFKFSSVVVSLLLLAGCASNITGSVKFMDRESKPEADAKLEGIVVNMINITSQIGEASYSVKTDNKGKFAADPKQLKPGTYKIEVNEPGYLPASKTIEFKDSSREVEIELKKMPTGGGRSYRGMQSDKDKIINPGEVNIQPPSM